MTCDPYSLSPQSTNPPRHSTICITGGGSGIGLATAVFLHAAEYHNNVAVFDKGPLPPDIKALTESPRFLYVQCDVVSWSAQRSAFAQTASKFGSIDHVFINAGVSEIGEQIFTDTYDSNGELKEPNRLTIDVDIRAVGDSLKLAIHHLRADTDPKTSKRRGSGKGCGGSIVMTASLAGYLASSGAPLYSAAKHGVVGFMRALKSDCGKLGIAISIVAPGITLTPIILGRREGQSLDDWGKEMAERGVPINTAETVALAVANLMGKGKEANGSGVLIQGGQMKDLEETIARSRQQWMGKEMLDRFRAGRNAPLFPNRL